MSKKVRAHLKTLVDDLTTLQINTIRQADLTGEGMTDPRHGLHDIADKYNTALNRLLKGDVRRIVGKGAGARSVVTVHFVEAAYRPGDGMMMAVAVHSDRGAARAKVAVKAMFRRAPSVTPIDSGSDAPSAPKAQMVPGTMDDATAYDATTDEHGAAFVFFNVPKDARPGCCVALKMAGVEVDIEIPLTKVHGDLTSFNYLNRRANEAPDRAHWLIRRIELNSVRLVSLLQSMPISKGVGCDTNHYSRRELNGAGAIQGVGGRQAIAKPPPMALAPADLVQIRKIWELGCEQIVMQTIVQLDGDVVTRLSGGLEGEQHRIIHRVHADGVRVATESWQYLVETVAGLTKSFLGWFAR